MEKLLPHIALCTLTTDIQEDGTALAKCHEDGREITVHNRLIVATSPFVAGRIAVAFQIDQGKYVLMQLGNHAGGSDA